MFLDRIIEDALGFIRRFLWWRSRQDESTRKPFQAMRSHSGDWGMVSLVVGRDTPRAVRTWIYSAKRTTYREAKEAATTPPHDLHFYLDFLGPLPSVNTPLAVQEREERQAKRRQGILLPTHRLFILKASHFLNASGFYDCELIFWQDYDFYVFGSLDPERVAMLVLDKTVLSCLKMTNPMELSEADWKQKVDEIVQQVKFGDSGLNHRARVYRRSEEPAKR